MYALYWTVVELVRFRWQRRRVNCNLLLCAVVKPGVDTDIVLCYSSSVSRRLQDLTLLLLILFNVHNPVNRCTRRQLYGDRQLTALPRQENCDVHVVRKKRRPCNYFSNISFKNRPILIIGVHIPEDICSHRDVGAWCFSPHPNSIFTLTWNLKAVCFENSDTVSQ